MCVCVCGHPYTQLHILLTHLLRKLLLPVARISTVELPGHTNLTLLGLLVIFMDKSLLCGGCTDDGIMWNSTSRTKQSGLFCGMSTLCLNTPLFYRYGVCVFV